MRRYRPHDNKKGEDFSGSDCTADKWAAPPQGREREGPGIPAREARPEVITASEQVVDVWTNSRGKQLVRVVMLAEPGH